MKKSYILIGLFLILIVIITIIGSIFVSGNIELKDDTDIFTIQRNKEVYFNVYGYSIDTPNIIVNPYGNSPLTALVMFETNDYSEVNITVKSKTGNSDINYTFGKDKYHMIPIYGLYANYNNTVIIKSEGVEKVINITTDSLPDDFLYVDSNYSNNFVFYNNNYPYAVDADGEVRWYLNKHYFGNITYLDNSSFIIGSDRYKENGNTISFYKMNLLGKIYNEYILSDGYYGYSALYDDNILVISDKLLLIDIQTGDIIQEYMVNDDYDFLDVVEGNIVLGKNDKFYRIINDNIEETVHNSVYKNYSFYNNTTNYKIIPSERYGFLGETSVSDKKVALLNYDNIDELNDVEIVKEIDRLKIINKTGSDIYLILDKFMDKRIYDIKELSYVNLTGLNGKYTIYFNIQDNIYKTDYYIEV